MGLASRQRVPPAAVLAAVLPRARWVDQTTPPIGDFRGFVNRDRITAQASSPTWAAAGSAAAGPRRNQPGIVATMWPSSANGGGVNGGTKDGCGGQRSGKQVERAGSGGYDKVGALARARSHTRAPAAKRVAAGRGVPRGARDPGAGERVHCVSPPRRRRSAGSGGRHRGLRQKGQEKDGA
jgi:hypothetical protein